MSLLHLKQPHVIFALSGFIALSAVMYRLTVKWKTFSLLLLLIIEVISLIVGSVLRNHLKLVYTVSMISAGAIAAVIVSVAYINMHILPIQNKYNGTSAKINAEVLSSESASYGASSVIRIKNIDEKNVNIKAKLFTEYPCDAEVGDEISLSASFEKPPEDTIGYSENDYMLANGIILNAVSEKDDVSFLGSRLNSPSFLIYRFRSHTASLFSEKFGDEAGGFMSGLMLGDKYAIPDTVRRDFRQLGLSHILAVSGLHLSVLCGAVAFILKRMKTGKIFSLVAMGICIIIIAAVTGASPSVMRAAIMSALCWYGYLFGRYGKGLLYLMISVSMILLLRPGSAADIGLWMSFSATLGLLVAASPIEKFFVGILPSKLRRIAAIRAIVSTFAASIAAITFTLPVSYIYFGQMSVIAPIANIIFCYPLMAVLFAAPLIAIFAHVPLLLYIPERIVAGIIRFVLNAAGSISNSDRTCISLNYPFTAACAAAGIAVFAALTVITSGAGRMTKMKKFAPRFLSAIVTSAVLFSSCVGIYSLMKKDIADITCFSYSKNDACVISINGKSMYIDSSTGGYTGFYKGMNYLSRYNSETDLDCYLITHYHMRHIASFTRAVQNYYIRTLLMPEPVTESEKSVFLKLSDTAAEYGCKVIIYPSDETAKINFDKLTLEICRRERIKRSDHPVISYIVSNGADEFLYIGASAYESEEAYSFCSEANASAVYFGIHGPVQKLKPALEFNNLCAVRYCATLPYPPDNADPVEIEAPLRIRLK